MGDCRVLGEQRSRSVKGERRLFVTRTFKHFEGFCIILFFFHLCMLLKTNLLLRNL
jgi:hypothetical protein